MTKVEFRLLSEGGEVLASLALEGMAIFSPSGVAAVPTAELERIVRFCSAAFYGVATICSGKGLEPGVDLDELTHYVSQSVTSRSAPDSPVRAPLIRANVRVRPASGTASGADADSDNSIDWDAMFGNKSGDDKNGDIEWESLFGIRPDGNHSADRRTPWG